METMMMEYRKEYEKWLSDPAIDNDTRQELQGIGADTREIEDRFYTHLAFGTGGLRGVIGAGTNRMNIYTVRKATQGLAHYILSQGEAAVQKGVVIAHDSRRMSPEFCEEAALVLNGNGIRTYVFDDLRPTPLLSFAVRHLGCTAGIVITASHNPPEYNGYKVYWDDGGQVPHPRDQAIIMEVNKITDFLQIKTISKKAAVESGLFSVAGPEVDDAYVQAILSQRRHRELPVRPLKIVFTPLHGAGNVLVRRVLDEAGYKDVYVVEAQAAPDGNFPTVAYPNPEDFAAFAMAETLAWEKDADLIICTDPDGDRLGVALKNEMSMDNHGYSTDKYIHLTGNMTGVLLTEYLLSERKVMDDLPANGAIVSTIVSTEMSKSIARAYGVTHFEVLTGFKYIGEKIKEFEQSGAHTYLFGFEESCGYLAGDYARDKDAVEAALLVCEAAAYYRQKNMSLWDAMVALYKKYGYFKESLESVTLKGLEGLADMRRIMADLRRNPFKEMGGLAVVERRDYRERVTLNCITGQTKTTGLPCSDVLYYVLEDGSWLCIRPSGTEPKIKLYFGTVIEAWDTLAEADAQAQERLGIIKQAFESRL